LQFLVEERRKFVHDKTRYSNRLTAHLKMYFLQMLDWFDEIGSNIAAEFCSGGRASRSSSAPGRPPSSGSSSITTAATRSVSRTGWSRFGRRFRQPRMPPWSHRRAWQSSHAGLLKQVLVAITAYDKQIDELARAHPDYALVKSFPGAGPAMAPRLIAAMGSERDRYQSAAEIQQYRGIAPVVATAQLPRIHRDPGL
jgi:hypothetical protein